MSWMWNSYLQEVSDNNARLINVRNGAGNLLSQNGLYAYGVPAWGNCCTRNYDTQYNVSAPYLNASLEANDQLSFEGGIRFDMGKVTGSFAGSSQSAIDINNDGIISAPETSVSSINTANTTAVNYDYNYVSYSVGANYALNNSQSFFARYSKGASAKADRVLFERPAASYLNGDLINSLDYLAQAELGYKHKYSRGYVYGTFFYAKTDEQSGFEATNPSMLTQNNYKSLGLEVESAYNVSNNIDLRGGFTYTKAEITSGSNAGNAPRRQPKLMYSVIPSYKFSKANSAGLSFMGQTQAYAQDSNQLVMNGFVLINGFVELGITNGLSLNIAGNNLLDTLAITEVEEGSITENTVNYVRARPFPGRSISMALTYKF
jgi:outer membrane receptor protein involved in Fe transport